MNRVQILGIVLAALIIIDYATTMITINAGRGVEANPLARSIIHKPEAVVAITIMIAMTYIWYGGRVRRYYNLVYRVILIAIIIRALTIIHTLLVYWGVVPL